jgi:ACS family glucarate transporter-like MFS transporter
MNIFQGRVRWLLVVWMLVISAISYLDRVNLSIAIPWIEKEFHLDHIRLGWVLSAWVLGYALFQAPSGRMADRFGPRRIILLGTIWWAVFSALTALTPANIAFSLVILMVVRFLLGVGESIVYPATNRIVAAWIPSRERGLANGLIFAGVGLGAASTPPLIAYIIYHWSWRVSMWACAFIGLMIGVVWYVIARDDPEHHPWVSGEEQELIAAGLPHATRSAESQSLPWRTILGSGNVWIVTASYFGFVYVAYIFFTWFFSYLNLVRGLDLKQSAGYAMLPPAAMAIGCALGGWVSDHLTRRHGNRLGRCHSACVAMILAAVFVGLGPHVSDARLASVVLAGGAGALYLAQSAFWSVSSDIGGRSAGAVSGVMNMGGQFGGATTASLTPYVAKHFGWNMSFWVAAAFCFVGALAWLLVDPDRQLKAVTKSNG